jgi:pimeloyl-ACP methyl ester carboxylesterase
MADASRDVTIRQVPTATGRLHVADHAGDEPALVLVHGFPDDSRIYNRLVPLLSPRRAAAFDFLGYGGSDRPQTGAADPAGHLHPVGAVLDELGVKTAVLAGLDIPVGLVFGALDRYLSPGLAAHLASLFPRADLHLVDGASHWPQWDAPEAVSGLIR